MTTNPTEMVDHYARGLLAIVEAEDASERVEDELYRFARAIEGNNELRAALADPQTVGAVSHVVQSGRGRMLVEIIEAFTRLAASRRERAVAEVRTAVELSPDQRERLRAALGAATGRDVELKVVIDADVVGGVLATVGDTVIDGTVSRQLARMRSQLASA
jgi:F-type H+-transporting ATPase subunit delta